MITTQSFDQISKFITHSKMAVAVESGTEKISEVFYDSRTIYDGRKGIFFAFITSNRDGHKYIEEAYSKGVRHFVLQNPEFLIPGTNSLIVEDSLKALQEWAGKHRKNFDYPVIGITGSNGKTQVKEWLISLLTPLYQITASPGSYNSQIGVPLSLLRLSSQNDLAIIEVGISRKGEMDILAKMVSPTHGVFTHFGDAHREGFSSMEDKLEEKCLLFNKVHTLFSSSDSPIRRKITSINHFHVGKKEDSNIQINQVVSRRNGSEITVSEKEEEYLLSIPHKGPASVENYLLCVLIARTLGQGFPTIIENSKTLAVVEMRMEIISENPEITIINDTYNSDFESINNAFSLLEEDNSHELKMLILSDIDFSEKSDFLEIISKASRLFGESNITIVSRELKDLFQQWPGLSLFKSVEDLIKHFDYDQYKETTVLIKGGRSYHLEKLVPYLSRSVVASEFIINLNHLTHNLRQFKSTLKEGTKTMAMVKAFSYGTGSWEVANELEREGIDYLAVAYISEGINLRNSGIKSPIMVMNPDPSGLDQLIRFSLEPEIFDLVQLEKIIRRKELNSGISIKIHIKLETGMNRLGFQKHQLERVRKIITENPFIQIASVFSHLSVADNPEKDPYTYQQIEEFEEMRDYLCEKLTYKPVSHILNTSGIIRFPDHQMDMVRVGIGLYGIAPVKNSLALREVGTLRTYISHIRTYDSETFIGYGNSGKVGKESIVATIPIGYADGILRSLSKGAGQFLVQGKKCPIVGMVCMDMCMIDVSEVLDPKIGDEVLIFGDSGKHFQSVNAIAKSAGTISYEILSGISRRVHRMYLRS